MSEGTAAAHFGSYMQEPPLSPPGSADVRTIRTEPRSIEPPKAQPAPPEREWPYVEEDPDSLEVFERSRTGTSVGSLAFGAAVAPEPAPEPEAAPVPRRPEPAQGAAPAVAGLFLRLANGERIPAGSYSSREVATYEGRLLSFRMINEEEWLLVDGRYVRPDAVVSVDIETLGG